MEIGKRNGLHVFRDGLAAIIHLDWALRPKKCVHVKKEEFSNHCF